MVYDLFQVIATWQQIGIYGVVLPFILVFTLCFAILEKTNILGQNKKNLNIIISLVMGLLFLQNVYLVERVQFFLPNVAFAVIVFLMLLLLMGVSMGDAAGTMWANNWKWAALVLAVLALLWASTTDMAGFGFLDWWASMDDSLKQMIFLGVFIALIVFFVQKGDSTGKPKKEGS